jgi:multidrug efflux system membrane fusion protein
MKRIEPQRHHWIFISLGVLAVILVAWVIFHRSAKPPAAPPAVPVSAVRAQRQDIAMSITALGAAQAWTSVTVLAQVSGKLLTVNFTEGTDVQKGQLLAQIDPAPYLAILTQAQGTLERDRALLANARLDLIRYQNLMAQNAISAQVLDTQAALVKQDEGTVLTDQGAVQAAQVNVDYCRIVSPVDGRVGVRLVDPGNLVSAGGGGVSSAPSTAAATNNSSSTSSNSGIVVVNQIEPIAVTFTVPEGEFQNLSNVSNNFTKPLLVRAMSQETGAELDSGELSIADNRIDPATGTVELKARFPNEERHLWPGQFVNVQLTLQTLAQVTTIPEDAVNRGPNGAFVFLVGQDNVATIRPITTGWTQGTTVVITKGLDPGDQVVTDGQMVLKAGSKVRIVAPAAAQKKASGNTPASTQAGK